MHTILDMLTLVATAAVIYELRFKLVDTYQDDQDSVKTYYVVRMALLIDLSCLCPLLLLWPHRSCGPSCKRPCVPNS